MAERSKASRQKKVRYFDAKFCFAFLASLRSAILKEISVKN